MVTVKDLRELLNSFPESYDDLRVCVDNELNTAHIILAPINTNYEIEGENIYFEVEKLWD